MAKSTSLQPALSPVNGKPILLGFDGADMSSDAGLTLLRKIERRNELAGLLASCLEDWRGPIKVRYGPAEIIRFRTMMIAAGHEDGNDAGHLRHDPGFKLALEPAFRRMDRGLRLRAPHRRHPRPADPPRPHSRDERRKLSAPTEPQDECLTQTPTRSQGTGLRPVRLDARQLLGAHAPSRPPDPSR